MSSSGLIAYGHRVELSHTLPRDRNLSLVISPGISPSMTYLYVVDILALAML